MAFQDTGAAIAEAERILQRAQAHDRDLTDEFIAKAIAKLTKDRLTASELSNLVTGHRALAKLKAYAGAAQLLLRQWRVSLVRCGMCELRLCSKVWSVLVPCTASAVCVHHRCMNDTLPPRAQAQLHCSRTCHLHAITHTAPCTHLHRPTSQGV